MRKRTQLAAQRLTTERAVDIPERIAMLATLTGDAVVIRFDSSAGWGVNGWPSVWSLTEAFDLAIRAAMHDSVDAVMPDHHQPESATP